MSKKVKTAKDYLLTLAGFGVNMEDDDQIAAVDKALSTHAFLRADMDYSEKTLRMGGRLSEGFCNTISASLGAEFQAAGIRPEELR